MEMSSVSALTSGMASPGAADVVQLIVLKKVWGIKAQNALQLIQATFNIIRSRPPHLGNSIEPVA